MTRVKRVELAPGVAPWKRQPGETLTAWEAFDAYRKMGPGRTLTDLAKELGRSVKHVHDMSSAGQWRARLDAWLEYQDQVFDQETVERAREAARQNEALLKGALAKAGRNLMALEDPLTPDQTIRLVDLVLKHQTSVYGDALKRSLTGRDEQQGQPQVNIEIKNFTELSDEGKLRKLRDLAQDTLRWADAASNAEDE